MVLVNYNAIVINISSDILDYLQKAGIIYDTFMTELMDDEDWEDDLESQGFDPEDSDERDEYINDYFGYLEVCEVFAKLHPMKCLVVDGELPDDDYKVTIYVVD